jgi:3-methyladenine DNA glycosylase AlkC
VAEGRVGARSRAAIAPDVLDGLNAGRLQTATLSEALAIDFAALFATLTSPSTAVPLAAAAGQGVTRRMAVAGGLALAVLGDDAVPLLSAHPADTVRGWAAYAIAMQPGLDLPRRLEAIRPLADDGHFGVREWAWLALRPHIAADPLAAIAMLAPWAAEPSANLRRFASEATRPRGVWCTHIEILKVDPAPGLAVLEPLRADGERYVQDSVANWLNDAAKTRADWVRRVCVRWRAESPVPATARISKRALRSLE